MRMICNCVRSQKAKRMLTVCLAFFLTLSFVIVSPMQGTYAGLEPVRTVIDLSDPSSYSNYLVDGVIVLRNDENGYELTGSNTDGDISIRVPEEIEVSLYLKTLNLVNSYSEGIDSVTKCPKGTKPAFLIEGTAKIYVRNNCDSLIKGVSDIITVTDTGRINFTIDQLWTRNPGSLTIESSDIGEADHNYLFNGSGDVSFAGGKTQIKPISGKSLINCDLSFWGSYCSFTGKTVMCEGNSVNTTYKYRVPENLNTELVSVQDGNGIKLVYYDSLSYSNETTSDTFPKNKSLLQFNDKSTKSSEIKTDENGCFKNIWLPSDCRLFIEYTEIGENNEKLEKVSCYSIENSKCIAGPVPAYKITLMNADGSSAITGSKSYYAAEGDKVTLLSDHKYVYSYYSYVNDDKENPPVPVTAETVVKGNMTIYVTATEGQELTITVYKIPDSSGQSTKEEIKVKYGYSLDEAGITVPCYAEDSYNIFFPYNNIVDETTYHEIGNITVIDGEHVSLAIGSKAEAELFAKLVNGNSGKVINGTLETDIELDNGFDMIGSKFAFKGVFDGNNHTVRLNLDKDAECVGLFAKADKGAVIKNVNVTGTVKGKSYVGGLVGKIIGSDNRVEISGCTNSANITAEMDAVGGIVGGAGKSKIECCVNTGKVETVSDNPIHKNSAGAIAGNSTYQSNLEISNCIDVSESNLPLYSVMQSNDAFAAANCYSASVESAGVTKKSAEAFASGEVTYLLNTGMGETKWFQTCDKGLPMLCGDALTQTVYAGYDNCYSENFNMYSNDSDIHTEKGHQDKGEYTYSEGRIQAVCRYCDKSFTADVSIPREVYGDSLEGVAVVYGEDWENAGFPEITIEYSTDSAGIFSSAKPETAGTFCLKALVGSREIDIEDTYTIVGFDTENWVSDENSHWHASVNGTPDEVIDKANHTWNEGKITTEATCTEAGVRTFNCTVCEKTKTEKIEAIGHSFDEDKWTTDENNHWRAAVCGDTDEVSEKAVHTWDAGKVTTEATCTEAGVRTFTCTVCEKIKTEKIEATGHSFDEEKWTTDENNHWRAAVCGDTDEISEKAAHIWDDGKVTTEATCTEAGVRTFTCTVCEKTKTEIIEPTGHSFDTDKWTTDENNHWRAAVCGDTDEISEKAAHTWDAGKVTKEATIGSTGIMSYTCTVCKAVKNVEIPKLTPTQAPTGTPTQAPTQAPTGTPSQTPTQAPTGTPSQTPTQAPTGTPSQTPTQAPAGTPSQTPTQAPTGTPSQTPTQAPTGTPVTPTRAPENRDNTNTNTGDVTGVQDTKPEEKVTTVTNEDGTSASIPESFVDSIKLTKSEQKAVENGAEIKLEVSADEKKATKTEKKNVQAAADEIAAALENIGIMAGNGTVAGNTDGTDTGAGNTDGTNTGAGNTDGTNNGAGNADGTNTGTGNTDGNTTGTGSADNTASAPSLTVGPTYNVSMTKQVGDGEKKAVKTNGSEVSFTVTVPVSENLLNTDDSMKRLYFMVSTNADGTQNIVPAKLDNETNSLSFESSGNGKVTLVTADVAYFEEKGTELTTSQKLNAKYEVSAPGTRAGQIGGVVYTGPQKRKASLTIKDTVKINGITYKISSIAEGAFAGNKKLKKLTIGKNITTIGAGAFKGCKNLKEIIINSKLLKAKNLSAAAFEGLREDAVIYVPAKKLNAYTAMFRKLGVKAELKAIK